MQPPAGHPETNHAEAWAEHAHGLAWFSVFLPPAAILCWYYLLRLAVWGRPRRLADPLLFRQNILGAAVVSTVVPLAYSLITFVVRALSI